MAIPARELHLRGHEAVISTAPMVDFDVYVFAKHYQHGEYWYAKAVKGDGKLTVMHICDDHFETENRAHYYRMLEVVDRVITPTQVMAEKIKHYTGRDAIVIPDTYEFPKAKPCFTWNNDRKLNVLWFGNPFNLMGLKDTIPLADYCELRLCTRIEDDLPIKDLFAGYHNYYWSLPNMLESLAWCDVVIIPVRGLKMNTGRSANRLMESVRQGKFVIATPIDSYQEFTDMYLGDIHEGLEWLRTQSRESIEERIKNTQAYIEDKYRPSRIGELWQTALT
jgi:hypothetical protein